jgi:hypothetical protein
MWLEFHDAEVDPRHLSTDYQQQPADMAGMVAGQLGADTLLVTAGGAGA